MFTHRLKIFTLFGFDIYLDASWVLLAILVVWTLATGVFPFMAPGLSPSTYWWMGILGAIGLFASIVLHELAHAVVARRYGMPIVGITLFIFGGVAELRDEPPSAKAEFLMAGAGPLASMALAVVFGGAATAGPAAWVAVAAYLGYINGLLAIFNLIPAFPLDGGRMLRAALWGWKKDLRWATRIAAIGGSAFGILLIAWGVLGVVTGDFVGGMWRFLIGLFLRGAADAAYKQVLAREAFAGAPVARFMTRNPVTVAPDLALTRLVEDYFYRHRHKLFPGVREGAPVGCVRTAHVAATAREDWDRLTVADVMEPLKDDNAIAPGVDAFDALARMRETGHTRLLVVDGGRLLGILCLRDMLEFLSLTLEFEAGPRRGGISTRRTGPGAMRPGTG
ncbi:MAG TPA: site-2 protease family protein [Alphaproteobacteria bacterium]|nr:site-2 protease family protein [Alphaproteobacteria bacterium]